MLVQGLLALLVLLVLVGGLVRGLLVLVHSLVLVCGLLVSGLMVLMHRLVVGVHGLLALVCGVLVLLVWAVVLRHLLVGGCCCCGMAAVVVVGAAGAVWLHALVTVRGGGVAREMGAAAGAGLGVYLTCVSCFSGNGGCTGCIEF